MTARLTSLEADEREWRRELGLRARRLDVGEAVSIGIAVKRGLEFASDDEQALIAYSALTGRPPVRTRDVIKLLVNQQLIEEAVGRDGYRFLQQDDGIFTASIPAPARTASNASVNCPARSRIRNRRSAARSPRSISRLRICCVVQGPSGFAVTPSLR
jgi:hypothetical protein